MNTPIIIIGAGGHACVLVEMAHILSKTIIGVTGESETQLKNYPQITYLGNDSIISRYSPNEIKLVNGVGATSPQKNILRQQIFQKFKNHGYSFETLIHPSAIIAKTVSLGEGAQVMARVVLQPNTSIGSNTIINTGACIDHDCRIGHHVHVAPGVVLSGNVNVGDYSHVGVGANIIQSIEIGSHAMICAGTTVIKNVLSSQKVPQL
ncbi:MAG: acetyltransferase [Gammaproteobacteria bacterium]|jgi:UDP-perosamine 4-acetyltransferase|nr:acetyltransferase [Gammaproteobacteria bacterium]